ncbi:hypothetical protein GEW_04722 [Pasteurella multocida subsp. gallicida str. Anand1_poultry]|nr:hypothetical protein GEW_04722 [Pasteurella multocida subsp. gallicida str. Anand1_poultry]
MESIKRNERDAPRVPPARLGMRLSGNVTEHFIFLCGLHLCLCPTKNSLFFIN